MTLLKYSENDQKRKKSDFRFSHIWVKFDQNMEFFAYFKLYNTILKPILST